MIKAVKKFFRDRKVKKVRAENIGLAVMAQQRHEADIESGSRIAIKALIIGDVEIWSTEDGVL